MFVLRGWGRPDYLCRDTVVPTSIKDKCRCQQQLGPKQLKCDCVTEPVPCLWCKLPCALLSFSNYHCLKLHIFRHAVYGITVWCGMVWGDVWGKWCLRGYHFEDGPVQELHNLVGLPCEVSDWVGQFHTPFQIWFPQETLPLVPLVWQTNCYQMLTRC
jgi:hypothetical protein